MITLTFESVFVIGPIAGMWIYGAFGPTVFWAGIGALGGLVMLGYRWLDETQGRLKHVAKPA